jgi:hypothetical protein
MDNNTLNFDEAEKDYNLFHPIIDFIDNPKEYKDKISNFVSQFFLLDKVHHYFFQLFSKTNIVIHDFYLFSNQEKYLLKTILQNKNMEESKEFIELYNQKIEELKNINPEFQNKHRKDVLEKIKTIQHFLNIFPYNQKNFQNLIYQSIIDWEFSEDIYSNNKFSLLIKALHNYSDQKIIADLCSHDSDKVKKSQSYIEQKDELQHIKNKKDTVIKGTAAVCAMTTLILESSKIAPINVHGLVLIPTLVGTGILFFSLFSLLQKNFNDYFHQQKNKTIQNLNVFKYESKEMDYYPKLLIRKNLFTPLLYREKLDMTSQKDINIFLYFSEKLVDENIKLPQKMIKQFDLKKEDVDYFQISTSKIQELSNVYHLDLRKYLLWNHHLSENEIIIYKKLDNLLQIKDKKDAPFHFQDFHIQNIKNLNKDLEAFLETLNQEQKNIISSILLSNFRNGFVNPTLQETIFKELDEVFPFKNQNVFYKKINIITDDLIYHSLVEQNKKAVKKSSSFSYFKEISKLLFNQSKEFVLKKESKIMIQYIENQIKEYDFDSQFVIRKKSKFENVIESIFEKIQHKKMKI